MAAISQDDENLQQGFYEKWITAYESLIRELQETLEKISTLEHLPDSVNAELESKIERAVQHHKDYYRAKEEASSRNVLETMLPEWRTRLEKAFMWLGGWRPSMAFQLVYGLAGKHMEEELVTILHGMDTLSFASLSASQLSDFSRLQTRTNRTEDMLGHEMAILQQSFADEPLLTLAQVNEIVSPKSRIWDWDSQEDGPPWQNVEDKRRRRHRGDEDEGLQEHDQHAGNKLEQPGGEQRKVDCKDMEERHHECEENKWNDEKYQNNRQENSKEDEPQRKGTEYVEDEKHTGMGLAMQQKLVALKNIYSEADSLRLETLLSVLEILNNSVQKAVYLIAAFKIQTAVKNIGEKLNTGISFPNSSGGAA